MVDFECPWCKDAVALPFPLPDDPQASFHCTDCGTTIDWADEPAVLDLAA